MNNAVLVLTGAVSVLAPCVADAQPQHAYPANGQSPSQQQRDESQCATWATQQSGYDPARPPPTAVAQPAPVTGSGARVRGAAVGAAVGGIAGNDVGDAALRGGAVGGVTRRVRNRRAANEQNQANAQYAQNAQASWAGARGACLKGRGYTVD